MELSNKSNKIIVYEDYAELIVEKRDGTIFKIIIDNEDVDKVKQHKWRSNGNKYFKNPKGLYLHRFIMNCNDKNMTVDHIDGNPLNCLKSNLRICTEKENSMNHKIQSNNTSGCSGVTFRKDTNKWTVSIQVGYKVYRLGCYNSKEEAIRVRKEAEIKYFGEYRRKE